MLTWLDGRNGSSFNSIAWSGNTLSFSVNSAQGAKGLIAMVPVPTSQTVSAIMLNGSPVTFSMATVKGIPYARFTVISGNYQVSYR
jgi:hypothetical protein